MKELEKIPVVLLLVVIAICGCSSASKSKEVLLQQDGKERHWVIKSKGLIIEEHCLAAHGDLHVVVEYPRGVLAPQMDAQERDLKASAIAKVFWYSGNLMSRTEQLGGEPNGKDSVWWPNGKRAREAQFLKGQPVGIWKFYDQRGQFVGQGVYRNGARDSGIFLGNPDAGFSFFDEPMKKQFIENGKVKKEEVFLEELGLK